MLLKTIKRRAVPYKVFGLLSLVVAYIITHYNEKTNVAFKSTT